MTRKTLHLFVKRLAEHVEENGIDDVIVAFHGGEPLLLGTHKFEEFASYLRENVHSQKLTLKVQTNGLLLNEEWIGVFERQDVIAGLSLDGQRQWHDGARPDHHGKGTYDRTVKGLKLLQEAASSRRIKFGGVISVINPEQDARNFFHHLVHDLNVTTFSVLLPDADHDTYERHYNWSQTLFTRFLTDLFDCWWEEADKVTITLFDNLIRRIVGNSSYSESIGSMIAPTVIVETDGSLTAHDVLRITSAGVTRSDLNTGPISLILNDPLFREINAGKFREGVRCLNCAVYHICGGGFVGHRFSSANRFHNHSVYCEALLNLINHAYLRLHGAGPQKKRA